MNCEIHKTKDENQKNSLGIPAATFVEDVNDFMKKDENKENAELVLTRLDEQYGKYKFMEMNVYRKKQILKKQVPDIKASLEMLKLLKLKKENKETINTIFTICDDLYVKANIPPTDKVVLWLGANIMLEYELQDAEDLLNKNLKATVKTLSEIEVDLDFLKEQLTTIEVNMAQVYNWDVQHRANEKK